MKNPGRSLGSGRGFLLAWSSQGFAPGTPQRLDTQTGRGNIPLVQPAARAATTSSHHQRSSKRFI